MLCGTIVALIYGAASHKFAHVMHVTLAIELKVLMYGGIALAALILIFIIAKALFHWCDC